MYHKAAQQFLSPRQLLRAAGFPAQAADAELMGVLPIDWPALGLRPTQLCHMAGNSMHTFCVGAVLFVVMLYVDVQESQE